MAYEERETGNLIGSDKVEGTAVYGADNQRIGSIERVMIDKRLAAKSLTRCSGSAVSSGLEMIIIRFRGNHSNTIPTLAVTSRELPTVN